MKTRIRKQDEFFIVDLNGTLDFEAQGPLKEEMEWLINEVTTGGEAPRKIIFNLKELSFVGSSGISNFIQTLKQVNSTVPIKPRYCYVRSEFQKLIRAFDDERLFEFFESEDGARRSFDN